MNPRAMVQFYRGSPTCPIGSTFGLLGPWQRDVTATGQHTRYGWELTWYVTLDGNVVHRRVVVSRWKDMLFVIGLGPEAAARRVSDAQARAADVLGFHAVTIEGVS